MWVFFHTEDFYFFISFSKCFDFSLSGNPILWICNFGWVLQGLWLLFYTYLLCPFTLWSRIISQVDLWVAKLLFSPQFCYSALRLCFFFSFFFFFTIIYFIYKVAHLLFIKMHYCFKDTITSLNTSYDNHFTSWSLQPSVLLVLFPQVLSGVCVCMCRLMLFSYGVSFRQMFGESWLYSCWTWIFPLNLYVNAVTMNLACH